MAGIIPPSYGFIIRANYPARKPPPTKQNRRQGGSWRRGFARGYFPKSPEVPLPAGGAASFLDLGSRYVRRPRTQGGWRNPPGGSGLMMRQVDYDWQNHPPNRFRLGRGLFQIPFTTSRGWLVPRKFPRLSGVSGFSILGFVAFESVPWLH